MPGRIQEAGANEFDSIVASGVVLVDFWAQWCGPCLMQIPILEKVAQKWGDRVKFVKVNVDQNTSIAARHGIRSIPILLLYKDGRVVRQLVGVQSETALDSVLEAVTAAGS
ncbi:MAG TPA: thioredoxin [Kiritimatiellae bacterium]|nr:thioredoxin [Kiritimatiellia bacterium]